MFKFLHTADIHLDSPLQSLARYEGAPLAQLRLATRRAFENVVQTAIDEGVRFVLISGDLFDRDWRDYNTGLFLVSQLARLREAAIRAYIISGNHDAANRITHALRWPDNVHFFTHKHPETFVDNDLGIAVHGQSFATQNVTDDISSAYPAPVPGLFNIGLLHTSADGRKGHDRYAPCTPSNLGAKGYHYWALGHVHTKEILRADPCVVFPGNTQGRHAGESGPKGCYIGSVDEQQRVALQFVPSDVARWEICSFDAPASTTVEETFHNHVSELVAASGGRPLVLRVKVAASAEVHRHLAPRADHLVSQFRAIALETGYGAVWIEKVVLARKPDLQKPACVGPVGEVVQLLSELRSDPALLGELAGELSDLRDKIAGELHAGSECPDPMSPEALESVLDEVESLLVGRLVEEGGAQ